MLLMSASQDVVEFCNSSSSVGTGTTCSSCVSIEVSGIKTLTSCMLVTIIAIINFIGNDQVFCRLRPALRAL